MNYIIFTILFLYFIHIIKYFIGWQKNKKKNNYTYSPNVTVVIAMRNEENEVGSLLNSLKSQNYPIDNLEFIIVNDHSSDATLALLKESDLKNLKIINMPDGVFGKKNAISLAVSISRGDIILSSDADCRFNTYWIDTMTSYFKDNNVKLVSGPVVLQKKHGFFQALQSLEFISLIASGAGAIGINSAIFCNGANMAYTRDVFLEINNYDNDNAVSGDDVFLLHRVKFKYPKSIVFAKDQSAIVSTKSLDSIDSFISQRVRWTSKSSEYKDFSSIYTSFLVLLTNFSFIFLFLMIFLNNFEIKYFLFFYFIKCSVDIFFLYPAIAFLKRKNLIKWIFIFELFYAFYVIWIVVFSLNRNFEWKGRIHEK